MNVDGKALEREREELQRELLRLDARGKQIRLRLADIEAYFDAVDRVTGRRDRSAIEESLANESASVSVVDREKSRIRIVHNDGSGRFEKSPTGKRIPSTGMVADMINATERGWARDEIREGFDAIYGIPEAWGNPNAAINNAIARAIEQGRVEERNGKFYGSDRERGRSDR